MHLPVRRLALLACLATVLAVPVAHAGDLTADEQRWLHAAWPVVAWAREAELPLDVVVQPQDEPRAPPLAMAWIGGRCKLVLSMRGNPHVQATEERTPAVLLPAVIELMAAHELGHCRRYMVGRWFSTPVGFDEPAPQAVAAVLRAAYDDMRATRREEAYADLVGLAWVQRRLPDRYADLHRWLLAERLRERVAGAHHDTLPWVRRAADPRTLAQGSFFDAAEVSWVLGLASGD